MHSDSRTSTALPLIQPPQNSHRLLQDLPEELLELVLQDVSFTALRCLLHCPSIKLQRLARFKLQEMQSWMQASPGAAEQAAFVQHRPILPLWPEIEIVGKMFLGKEFLMVDRGYKDDFVSRVPTLIVYGCAL